jgi:hypothetical protein
MNIIEETKEMLHTFSDRVKYEILCRSGYVELEQAVNDDVKIDFEVD